MISIHCSLQHIVVLLNINHCSLSLIAVIESNIGKQIEMIHFQWDEVDIWVTASLLQLTASLTPGYVLLQTRETTKHPLFSITHKNRVE